MPDIPQRLAPKDCEMVATWLEKQVGAVVKIDRSTALLIAATLRWITKK